tara:strand:- start:66 stop:530 length:465 start_codon:yes stop_codon:yes gene_type:complete
LKVLLPFISLILNFLAILKKENTFLMRNLIVLVLLFLGLIFPSKSYASHIELKPCIQISHCVREELEVENISEPFEVIKQIIENTPRTKIVENDGDYLHAEVTSRIMKYVDDLEVSYFPENKKIIIRSESRVGEGDFGVNKKRVDLIKNKFFDI